MTPTLITPPAEQPVSLADAKAHLRIDHDDEDAQVAAAVAAATGHLDGWDGILQLALVTQTWEVAFAGFSSFLRLPLRPVQEITSVIYRDAAGGSQTLAADDYLLHGGVLGAYLAAAPGKSWPETQGRDDAVVVRFVAGYGGASDVPPTLKAAILLMMAHWFDNRGAVAFGVTAAELPLGVAALIAPYRPVAF